MNKIRTFILLCIIYVIIGIDVSAQNTLESGFKNPPPSAKARTWWHWLNGNITKEGITADLEAMKQVGIQEAQIFNVDAGYPEGSVTFMSEQWLELFKFAASEANRLGIELGFNNAAGWANTGGPWITPEYAMQKVVYSETECMGGKKIMKQLSQPPTFRDYYKDIIVLAFPKPKSGERISDLDFKNLSERIRNHLEPETKQIPSSAIVRKENIINLTSKMSVNGLLEWQAPAGEWIILRIGHTLTGAENRPAVIGGRGWECDKMSKKAVDIYWEGGIQPIINKLGNLVGSTLVNCLIDSYEVGCGNWTIGFDSEFKRLRGYECTLFMPTFAGYYVESGEITERFLWDYRQTISDLMASNYYGHFRKRCHEHGMKLSIEPYWGPFNSMQVGDQGDIVMCEFWSGELTAFDSPKFVSSIAHLNGSSIVGAESFTGYGGWLDHPATIKSVGDKAWTEGINRFIFHTYTHQPWNIGPGVTFGIYGFDLNRLNTWWKQGKGFMDYIGRSQFLLQQGTNIADVLVFVGESSPNNAFQMPEIKTAGYDYDLIGTDKMMSLTVKDGVICTPVGGKYHVLILPETVWMTPKILTKMEELAKAGATIIGTKPQKSPSLQNYPACDEIVASLADKLWNSKRIKNSSLTDVLKKDKHLVPDFQIENNRNAEVSFIHRKVQNTDIYFLANSRTESNQRICKFRVTGKRPELWNPLTGDIKEAVVWKENADGTISLPISFDPEGSIFVIFRQPSSALPHVVHTTTTLEKKEKGILPDLKIIKAEYGTFLPIGLADVTEGVIRSINEGKLNIHSGTHLSLWDPAPGYVKELRIEYELDGKIQEIHAIEGEHIALNMDGKRKLTIHKAIYGKFDRGIRQIPTSYPVHDVKDKIKSILASGKTVIPVNDQMVENATVSDIEKELHIIYSSRGQTYKKSIPAGESLILTQESAEPTFAKEDDKTFWLTPYPGEITYTTSHGKNKTVKVSNVPDEIELTGAWNVNFKSNTNDSIVTVLDSLISWPSSTKDKIRYFSGTANYEKKFTLSKEQIRTGNSLELDLGNVYVMAEVIVNEKNLGILWKTPFKIDLDSFVHEGVNTLEVRITNLWVNKLIGEEQLPADFEWKNGSIKEWPEWLVNNTPRPAARTTFTTWKHWGKDSPLQPSGLLGPVIIRSYARVKILE
ncbi:glycosyl hydrolase [Parabacteroides pacaensis]|uniref:glycosyl hydrolase n=1 Tax=Parabacteroides pacaensis TaxID=2086575 RepID=UPI000D100ED8|nr:glycosyl hydrolase [Parabacteroides pacaensis]